MIIQSLQLTKREQFYIRQEFELHMQNPQYSKRTPPKLRIRRGLNTIKTTPSSYSYLKDDGEDIYLNIQITPIFSTPRLESIKIFNTKLQQSLKERQIQKLMKIQKKQSTNNIQSHPFSPKKEESKEKNALIDDKIRYATKTQFSKITTKKEVYKKYSLDTKTDISQKSSIFQIPLIKTENFGQKDIFDQLITSESSKGLIERLIKRKNMAREVQEQSPKKFFRYPLNRKIFNRVCNKNKNAKSLTMIGSFDNTASFQNEKNLEDSICMFNSTKRTKSKPFDNIFLSPSKRRQWQQTSKVHPHQIPCDTIIQHDGQQLGPWDDSGHPSLDI